MVSPQTDPQEWREEDAVERLLAGPDVRHFLAILANAVREAATRAQDETAAPPSSGHRERTTGADSMPVPSP
jgi:hypothetical protein